MCQNAQYKSKKIKLATDLKNIFVVFLADKRFISRLYKELYALIRKNKNNGPERISKCQMGTPQRSKLRHPSSARI